MTPAETGSDALPYGLLCLGIWVQVSGWLWVGAALVIAGLYFFNLRLPDSEAMNFVPRVDGESRWISATPTEVAKIKTKMAAMDKMGGGCLSGICMGCVVLAVFGLFITMNTDASLTGRADLFFSLRALLMNMLILSGAVMVLGTPRFWKPSKIVFKLPVLEKIMGWTKAVGASDWTREYQLELKKSPKGDVPVDIKICLKPPDCSKDFYGVQGQVSQNRGQPYVYFCVIAKTGNEVVRPPAEVTVPGEEKGFFGGLISSLVGSKDREVYETKKDAQVNVLVIRQYADKHGGYITSESDMKRLLMKSIRSADATVKRMPKEQA